MRRMGTILTLTAALVLLASPVAAGSFPESIPLPTGFQPEGVDTRGSTAYAGSLADGDVVTVDLRSGEVDRLVDTEGRTAVGLAVKRGLVLVAGGPTGNGFVYDAKTGEEVAVLELTDSSETFVNDVVVAGNVAWFTDSFQPQLYRVSLRGGSVGEPETVPLSGPAATFVPGAFNLNGIEARGGELIVVNSTLGALFVVDADGSSRSVDLGGDLVTNGDGLLLIGNELFVVRNQNNQVDVVELSRNLESGGVVDTITSDLFDVPTTVAGHGDRLVLVNARFGIADPEDAEYDLIQIPRH